MRPTCAPLLTACLTALVSVTTAGAADPVWGVQPAPTSTVPEAATEPEPPTSKQGYGIAKGLVGLPRYEAFVLKSGTWVYVEVPQVQEPASVSWLSDAPGWNAVVRTCPLADRGAWVGMAAFFGSTAAGNVPSTYKLPGTDGHTACVLVTAWGVTDDTKNVVNLNIAPASGPSFKTTLSRREAEQLAARLAALAQEVRNLPAPAPAAPPEPEGPSVEEVSVVAARTLYALKGWRRAGDPGWEADVKAVERAMAVGWLPSDVVVRGMEDRRMRPGALADVLGL